MAWFSDFIRLLLNATNCYVFEPNCKQTEAVGNGGRFVHQMNKCGRLEIKTPQHIEINAQSE